MEDEPTRIARTLPGWDLPLLFPWLAGALGPQVPFQLRYKLGNGNFGYNILLGIALFALGIIVVVGLSHLFRTRVRDPRREALFRRWSAASLGTATLLFVAAFLPGIPYLVFWLGAAAVAAWLLVSLRLVAAGRPTPGSVGFRLPSSDNDRKPWRFNGAFWLLVFVILLARDLWGLDLIANRTGSETALLLLGRFLTLGSFTVVLMLVAQSLLALFPKGLRWFVVTAAATVPLLVVLDFAAELYWQQSLLDIVNSFTLAGRFDVEQQLEAAGIRQSPIELLLLFTAFAGLATGGYLALQRLSTRFSCRARPARALLVFAFLWLGAIGQQALSMAVLRREIWQAEHATFKIHLGLLRPEPGLETIAVQFTEEQTPQQSEDLLSADLPNLARRPDIYVVMVETWRADSITPKVAPFLTRFRDEECQQFQTTFAGSNCTPVSWFTFFHSRLGIHWKEAVAEASTPGGLRGAYPLRLLHKLGYRFSVRAVCDLGYQEMSDLNFGSDHRLASEFLDNPMLPRGLEIPQREILVVDDLKKQLLASPSGGYLHFLSLDSPHYNYYWPENDFEPIHHDCAGNIDYRKLNPSGPEIREVVKRYENSIHWIDRQIEEFVTFLKAQNRYHNSIIILTGDHGEEFQEHGSWFHCSNLKRPQTEVPLLIKWPEWVNNQPPQDLATHLDVMPSVLDALGLEERFFGGLAGRSLLREHPGETVLSSLWAGVSGVGVVFIGDGIKANFAASRLWNGDVPETLYLAGYSDLDDNPLDPLALRGNLTHSEFLRRNFPDLTSRFFRKFGGE